MAALLTAQHVARAAQFEIQCCNLKARAEVAELLERSQPAPRNLRQFLLIRDEQIRIRAAVGAAHTPTKLIEFAQSMPIGSIDKNCIG